MNIKQFEAQYTQELIRKPDISCPEHLLPLRNHLMGKIAMKLSKLNQEGHTIEILDPDWCRANSEQAGAMHAEVIIGTYGSTYALPNKDPNANKEALESNSLDLYLLNLNGEAVGTACMVDAGDGYAELGRSASRGKSGNSVIQNMRILDWLSGNNTEKNYHTIFTTLRTAPDRIIHESDGSEFVMRGGEAVTTMWKDFPGLSVNGIAPLYFKHGALEQFTVAEYCKDPYTPNMPQIVSSDLAQEFIRAWHASYDLEYPEFIHSNNEFNGTRLSVSYPPNETGLSGLVHADISVAKSADNMAFETLDEVDEHIIEAGSPFSQLLIPTDSAYGGLLEAALEKDYKLFGYRPSTVRRLATLLLGKVREGVEVVPTFWQERGETHPFWGNSGLSEIDKKANQQWKI